jgi:hypothetical protein
MTTLNAALNYSFASTESARIASAANGADESIAAQIKQAAANSPYQVGATITAKYQYKVGEDGSLIPQQTTITHTAPDDDNFANSGNGRQRAYRDDDRRSSLSDLVNPKPELSPTDEVSLFATAASAHTAPVDITPSVSAAAPVQQAEVLDENGESVDAELITGSPTAEADAPQDKTSFMSLLAQRAQTAAANLYARNSDIIYSTTPIAQIAA